MQAFTPGSPRAPATHGQAKLRYFASARQGATLAQLLQAVRMAPGVIVMHGPSGAGKSLLCERLTRALEGQPFEPLIISSHLAHSIDLVNTLCDSLGLERSAGAIVDRLVQPANPLVLMLDHADDIDDAVLGDALTLLASRDVMHPSLRLVLTGSRALVQRVESLCPPGVSCRDIPLGTLRREDLKPYLLFVHGDDEAAVRLFDEAGPQVHARIATRTACLPGAINALATTLLAEAAASQADTLTTEMVDAAGAAQVQTQLRQSDGPVPKADHAASEAPSAKAPPLLAPVARAMPSPTPLAAAGTSADDDFEHTVFARPKADGSPTDLAPVRGTAGASSRPSRVLAAQDLRAALHPPPRRRLPRPVAGNDQLQAPDISGQAHDLPLPEHSDLAEDAEPGRGTLGLVLRYAALAIGGLAIFVALTGSPMLDSLLERLQGTRPPATEAAGTIRPDDAAARSTASRPVAPDQAATASEPTARGSIVRQAPAASAPASAAPVTAPASEAVTPPVAASNGDGVLGHGGGTGSDAGSASADTRDIAGSSADISGGTAGADGSTDPDDGATAGAGGSGDTNDGATAGADGSAGDTAAAATGTTAGAAPANAAAVVTAADAVDEVATDTVVATAAPTAGGGPSAPGVATSVIEDEVVRLSIVLPRTSAGDVLELGGLPAGSALGSGTRIDEGRWRLPAQPSNIVTITPPANFAGSFNVVATLRRSRDGSATTAHFPVDIEPVADTPWLDVRASPGDVNSALPLEVRTNLADGDGSERLSISLRDLPPTVQVSAGRRQDDGSWQLRRRDLKGLYLTPLPGTPQRLRFKVVATAREQSNNSTAEVTRPMEIRVVPDR